MLSEAQELSLMLDFESGKFKREQLYRKYKITGKELDILIRRGKWAVKGVSGKEEFLNRIVEGAGDIARARGVTGSNLKLPKEMTANMQVVAGLEGLSVIEFTLNIYRNMLEMIRGQVEEARLAGGENLMLDMKKFGFKSFGEFTDSLMDMLKTRMEHIKGIPNISEADDFENIVSTAISEIKVGVNSFQRNELPNMVYREDRKSDTGIENPDNIISSVSKAPEPICGRVIV